MTHDDSAIPADDSSDSGNSRKPSIQRKPRGSNQFGDFLHNPKVIKRQNAIIGVQKYTRPPKEKKRTQVNVPLTEEHRDEIVYLIRSWVKTSEKAKSKMYHVSYSQAYVNLFAYGLSGVVNAMDQIEDCEFEQCKKYLKQKIKIAESKIPKQQAFGESESRNRLIKAIHARCHELKISEETRKDYMRWRFRKNSLVDLLDDELSEMYGYTMGKKPSFKIPINTRSIQQDREKALLILVGVIEANVTAKGEIFNKEQIPISKWDVFEMLKHRNPTLFVGKDGQSMSEEQFLAFWKKQKVCKCKHGRQLGSGSQ